MDSEKASQSGKKGGGILVVVVLLVAVILALIGVVAYLVLSRDTTVVEEERRNVVITSDNVEEVMEQMESAEFVPPGYYTVTMTNIWHFTEGSSASYDAFVENKTENTNDVYFDVFLASDEENAIYKSPIIPLGSRLEEITLDTALDAGTYDCVAVYHLVDEEQHTVSTLRVAVTIIVEK